METEVMIEKIHDWNISINENMELFGLLVKNVGGKEIFLELRRRLQELLAVELPEQKVNVRRHMAGIPTLKRLEEMKQLLLSSSHAPSIYWKNTELISFIDTLQ